MTQFGEDGLANVRLTELGVGATLWHVHRWDEATKLYRFNDFNGKSRGRLSGIRATTPRSMYYAADTPSVALWETLLRDVMAKPDGTVVFDRNRTRGFVLAPIETCKPMHVIELTHTRLRGMVCNRSAWQKWLEVGSTPHHDFTHGPAADVIDHFTALGLPFSGFGWPSRQTGGRLSYVFFEPGTSSSAFARHAMLAPIDLAGDEGRVMIRSALEEAGLSPVLLDARTEDVLSTR